MATGTLMKLYLTFEVDEAKDIIDREIARLMVEDPDIPYECLEVPIQRTLYQITKQMYALIHCKGREQSDPSLASAMTRLTRLLNSFNISTDNIRDIEILETRCSIRILLEF